MDLLKQIINRFSAPLWLVFIGIVGAVSIWSIVTVSIAIMDYLKLNGETAAKVMEWTIVPIEEDLYAVSAKYSYRVDDREYAGVTVFADQLYRNALAGETYVGELAVKKWAAWYNQSNPQYSSLVKEFPLKQMLRTIVAVGVLLYFIWIGRWVSRH